MDELLTHLNNISALAPSKVVLSKPATKRQELKKIVAERKESDYQLSKYTEKQVFHENISPEDLPAALHAAMAGSFGQLNAWDGKFEYMLLLSSKGKCTFKRLLTGKTAPAPVSAGHNRKKNYLLEASADVAPLVDMGIFTKEGKIVNAMYDKYKQINRYLEIIDDAVRDLDLKRINVIDFGCGKSYLTFIVYYYLTYLKGIEAHIIGLDLKEDVIRKCNEAARRYGYENLRFELGDINGYKAPFDVDLVMTLHACDTATDFALYNAVQWGGQAHLLGALLPARAQQPDRDGGVRSPHPVRHPPGPVCRPVYRCHPGRPAGGPGLPHPGAGVHRLCPHPQKPPHPGGEAEPHAGGPPPAGPGAGGGPHGAIPFLPHPLPPLLPRKGAARPRRPRLSQL